MRESREGAAPDRARARRIRGLLAVVTAAVMVAGCSSGDAGGDRAPDESTATGVSANARIACERFYDWDLLLRTAGSQNPASPREDLRELRRLAGRLESAVYSAVVVRDLRPRSNRDAQRVAAALDRLWDAGGGLTPTTVLPERAARAADRLEKACVARGFVVPPANSAARAGPS